MAARRAAVQRSAAQRPASMWAAPRWAAPMWPASMWAAPAASRRASARTALLPLPIVPWTAWQPWLSFQQMLWQTAWAAPQVMMLRLADLGTAPLLWNARQRNEAARMVIEKCAAFNAGLLAAGRVLAGASATDHLLPVKLASAGIPATGERASWAMRQERRTPAYTTCWDEMLEVGC